LPAGPKSLETDEIDPIYSCEDPISASLDKRKKEGTIQSVVGPKNPKQGKFFYQLKFKGEPIKLEDYKIEEEAKPTESSEAAQTSVDDPIGASLKLREKQG